MVGTNLSPNQLQQLVDRTIRQGDRDGDGKLNFEEFCEFIKGNDISAKLSVDFASALARADSVQQTSDPDAGAANGGDRA